jgi:hypothetical protein
VGASADNTATFAIELDGTETKSGSEQAADALEKLKEKIEGDIGSIREMQKALRNLQGGSTVNIQSFHKLKDAITAKKAAIAQAQEKYISMGGTFKKTASTSDNFKKKLEEMTQAASRSAGPFGGLVGKVGKIAGGLGRGAVIAGIMAGAIIVLVAAVVGAVVALAAYGLAQANARRDEELHLEALTKLRNYYGIAAGSASQLQSAIDEVSGSVAIGRSKVASYAESLYKMGLRGQNLKDALGAVGTVAATQGDEFASRTAQMAAGINMAGGSVKKLADDVKARLGGIAARQMLSLGTQAEKLQESFAMLFSGVNIDGFLEALHGVLNLFSQSTASGRALKALIEGTFGPLGGVLKAVGQIAKRFFQGIIIGALEVGIVLQKVRIWFKKTFGGSDLLKGIDFQNQAINAGIAVVLAFAIILGVAAAAVFVLVAAFVVLGALIALPFAALYGLWQLLKDVGKWFSSTDWGELGKKLLDGFVNGIKRGVGSVISAVKGVANSARDALKHALGIASPSRVFASLGKFTAVGFAAGIDGGRGDTRRAAERLVDVPSEVAAPATTNVTSNKSARSLTVTNNITINADGIKDPEALAHLVQERVQLMLEGLVIQWGAT